MNLSKAAVAAFDSIPPPKSGRVFRLVKCGRIYTFLDKTAEDSGMVTVQIPGKHFSALHCAHKLLGERIKIVADTVDRASCIGDGQVKRAG